MKPEQTDPIVLRSRLEPFFPEGLDDHGKDLAVKYLAEIDGLEVEKVAILLAFEHVMVEQLSAIIQKMEAKDKGSQLVSQINNGVVVPAKFTRFRQ